MKNIHPGLKVKTTKESNIPSEDTVLQKDC